MLKNRTIAIAILSALLALSQVDAAPAVTPLAILRVAAKPTNPLHMGHPPGDFDRAFIAQQAGESWIQVIQTRKLLGTPHLDLSTNASCCVDQGSRAFAFHPGYATTRHSFVDYTNASSDTVVGRYSVTGDLRNFECRKRRVCLPDPRDRTTCVEPPRWLAGFRTE
jgi:hypothetical protein